MQVFFLYYFRSILLFINTLIASAYIELTLIKVRKVNASVIVEIKESSLFQCICILFRVHINEVWITISRHLRSKRKSVPLGDAYSAPCRGNPAPTWCLFGANSAPLSAFPKKMHGTCIFFVMCWMSVSDRLRKMAKKTRNSHIAVLFCTKRRKYGIAYISESVFAKQTPVAWDKQRALRELE